MAHSSLAVANFLLKQAGENGVALTPMKLLKLVHMCHGWVLGLTHNPLIEERIQAWKYGPVVPELYAAVRPYRDQPVDLQHCCTHESDFSEDETGIMKQVVDIYGRYTAIQLSTMTHEAGTPWSITWEKHGKNAPISNDLIEDHYAALYAKYSESEQTQASA